MRCLRSKFNRLTTAPVRDLQAIDFPKHDRVSNTRDYLEPIRNELAAPFLPGIVTLIQAIEIDVESARTNYAAARLKGGRSQTRMTPESPGN